MTHDFAEEVANKALVHESFDRWSQGTGGPFELLADDAEWTIVGSSPLAKTYRSKNEFITEVIDPFNARMAEPLVPVVRGIFADGNMVITLFDGGGDDERRQTLPEYVHLVLPDAGRKVVNAIAFFDNRDFDELWSRVSPAPHT